jgi:hypothetical protein
MKSEQEMRKWLFEHARRIGAVQDLQELFNKWDRAIALAPEVEKLEMSRMAILEVQSLLDINPIDGLTINKEVIIPRKVVN